MKGLFLFAAALLCISCVEAPPEEGDVGSYQSDPIAVEVPPETSAAPEPCEAPCSVPQTDCARTSLVDGHCETVYATPGTPCGFAGSCDGSGACQGLLEPLACPEDPCPGSGECTAAYCDPYTGACELHRFGNETSCGDGGRCNVTSGECCTGAMTIVCELPDPRLCWPTCAANLDAPGCSLVCVEECSLGMVPIRGICWPGSPVHGE